MSNTLLLSQDNETPLKQRVDEENQNSLVIDQAEIEDSQIIAEDTNQLLDSHKISPLDLDSQEVAEYLEVVGAVRNYVNSSLTVDYSSLEAVNSLTSSTGAVDGNSGGKEFIEETYYDSLNINTKNEEGKLVSDVNKSATLDEEQIDQGDQYEDSYVQETNKVTEKQFEPSILAGSDPLISMPNSGRPIELKRPQRSESVDMFTPDYSPSEYANFVAETSNNLKVAATGVGQILSLANKESAGNSTNLIEKPTRNEHIANDTDSIDSPITTYLKKDLTHNMGGKNVAYSTVSSKEDRETNDLMQEIQKENEEGKVNSNEVNDNFLDKKQSTFQESFVQDTPDVPGTSVHVRKNIINGKEESEVYLKENNLKDNDMTESLPSKGLGPNFADKSPDYRVNVETPDRRRFSERDDEVLQTDSDFLRGPKSTWLQGKLTWLKSIPDSPVGINLQHAHGPIVLVFGDRNNINVKSNSPITLSSGSNACKPFRVCEENEKTGISLYSNQQTVPGPDNDLTVICGKQTTTKLSCDDKPNTKTCDHINYCNENRKFCCCAHSIKNNIQNPSNQFPESYDESTPTRHTGNLANDGVLEEQISNPARSREKGSISHEFTDDANSKNSAENPRVERDLDTDEETELRQIMQTAVAVEKSVNQLETQMDSFNEVLKKL